MGAKWHSGFTNFMRRLQEPRLTDQNMWDQEEDHDNDSDNNNDINSNSQGDEGSGSHYDPKDHRAKCKNP